MHPAHSFDEGFSLAALSALGPEGSQELLQAVCNNATLALFIMDHRQHCRYMNPAAEQLTGYTLAEVQGHPLHDFVHHTRPDGRPYPLTDCPIDRAFPQNNQEQGEEVFVHKNGHFYPVAFTASPICEQGVPVGTIIEVRDISAERRASRDRDRFFGCPGNMLCIAHFDGYFQRVNQAFVDALGWPEAELLGHRVREFIHPDDLSATLTELAHVKQENQAYSFENRYRCRDGSYKWLLWTCTPFPEDQLLYGVAQDITERKLQQEVNAQLLVQAQEGHRLKDSFLANLSHELRTPLNAILGWVEMLLEDSPSPEDTRRGLEIIAHSAQTQARLIEDLLDVARISSGRLKLTTEPVNLAEVVQAALEVVQPASDAKQIQLQSQFDPQAALISGDATRLQQIIWNVLTNAIKFTPAEGQIQVNLVCESDLVLIMVQDTGKGIEPAFLPHVFAPFRQAEASATRRQGGLGIGLSIVRQLVQLHGGTIQVESAGPDQGTKVTLCFPCLPRSPKGTQPTG